MTQRGKMPPVMKERAKNANAVIARAAKYRGSAQAQAVADKVIRCR
jgi:hypothetical protein